MAAGGADAHGCGRRRGTGGGRDHSRVPETACVGADGRDLPRSGDERALVRRRR